MLDETAPAERTNVLAFTLTRRLFQATDDRCDLLAVRLKLFGFAPREYAQSVTPDFFLSHRQHRIEHGKLLAVLATDVTVAAPQAFVNVRINRP
jgi:hypothetical protein